MSALGEGGFVAPHSGRNAACGSPEPRRRLNFQFDLFRRGGEGGAHPSDLAPAGPPLGVDSRRTGMANVNKVVLIGNVTRSIEVKLTPKGTAVAATSLAINRTYRDDSGQKREEATFVDVELWGRLAEIAGEYVKKGDPLYIEGRLKQESWEEKETGKKRTRLKVVAESLQLLGSRPGKPIEKPDPAEESISRPLGPQDSDPF